MISEFWLEAMLPSYSHFVCPSPPANPLCIGRLFFVRFEGNSFCPKMAKLDFLPWNSIFSPENSIFRQFWANSTLQNIIWHKNLHGVTLFIAFLLSKFMGKGENLYLLALTYKILRKKLRNCFSERVKLVFKMLKLVFKTPKLPSPAFHWHVMGWISHKKKPAMQKYTHRSRNTWIFPHFF